jgi:hypothetical protein
VTDVEQVLRGAGAGFQPNDETSQRARTRALAALPKPTAGRRRSRTLVFALAAAVVALIVGGAAFAVERVVVPWFDAEPAPERVQLSFARLDVGATPDMESGVLAGAARRVTAVEIAGRWRVLWVAPTKAGGFCETWTNLFAGCTRDREPPRRLREGRDVHTFELGVTQSQNARGIVTMISGRLLATETERLELRYADGETTELRVVWVSPPIDAGFYLYEVPESHRRVGHQVSELVALDGGGDVIARQTFPLPPASEVEHPVRLPDGELVSLPEKAIVSRARKVIERTAWDRTRLWLWVMPTRDGGECFVSNRMGGCPPRDYELEIPMAAGIAGGDLVLFEGQVRSEVALVELHYEDGVVERLRPVEGFILHDIPKRQYERGHRLALAVALGDGGTVLDRDRYRPDSPGVYPCAQPVDIGHGVKACP